MINNKINPEVLKIAKINFEGNIIPQQWYKQITYPSGKPNAIAVALLSEIVYWYRPVIERDPATGETIGYRKKFKGDKLQKSYQSLANQFGFSKRQVQDSMKRLVELGLITIEFRNIKTETGLTLTNVMYVEPVTEEIERITNGGINKVYEKDVDEDTEDNIEFEEIIDSDIDSQNTSYDKTYEVSHQRTVTEDTNTDIIPPTFKGNTSYDKTYEVPHKDVGHDTLHRGTYTENTTKNTIENTTEKDKKPLQKKIIEADFNKESISTSNTPPLYTKTPIYSKRVNNKLAKLIKLNSFKHFLMLTFLDDSVTIRPCKYHSAKISKNITPDDNDISHVNKTSDKKNINSIGDSYSKEPNSSKKIDNKKPVSTVQNFNFKESDSPRDGP